MLLRDEKVFNLTAFFRLFNMFLFFFRCYVTTMMNAVENTSATGVKVTDRACLAENRGSVAIDMICAALVTHVKMGDVD